MEEYDGIANEHPCLADGAEDLIKGLQAHDWKTSLVSGGYTFYTVHCEANPTMYYLTN